LSPVQAAPVSPAGDTGAQSSAGVVRGCRFGLVRRVGFVGAGEALTGQGVEVFAEFPQLPDTVVTSGVGQQVQHERADVGVDVGDPFQHVVTVFVGVAAAVAVDVLVEDDAASGLVDDADAALGGVVV